MAKAGKSQRDQARACGRMPIAPAALEKLARMLARNAAAEHLIQRNNNSNTHE